MARKQETIDFEASLKELEQVVERMERGELTLEESLQQFERGTTLARQCQEALRRAEQKVLQLTTAADGGEALQPLDAEAETDAAEVPRK